MSTKIKEAFQRCIEKTKRNIGKMSGELIVYPEVDHGDYFATPRDQCKDFLFMYNWTTSFSTGMSLLSYEYTKEETFLKWVNSHYDLYRKKVFEMPLDTMHDLGFLYTLYSVAAYKITGDLNHRKVGLKAADELAKRFILKGGYISAWSRMDNFEDDINRGVAIIDCMMNLPLLFWASEETGHPYYREIACAHANMTMSRMVREDGSLYHAYRFDPDTGAPMGGDNFCGYAAESYWARGAAWAIYGFTIAYRYTKDQNYINTAKKIAYTFIENLKEDDLVPVWDFRLPQETPALFNGTVTNRWDSSNPANKIFNRDASAAAIAGCGFLELLQQSDEDERLSKVVHEWLEVLCSEQYFNDDLECPGMLKRCNGKMKYVSFGDYYLMEFLGRALGAVSVYW